MLVQVGLIKASNVEALFNVEQKKGCNKQETNWEQINIKYRHQMCPIYF
jgi:hypothetical protein